MSQLTSARLVINADISRIIKYAPSELIGREAETRLLKNAWAKVTKATKNRPHILVFVALGGEGKTSLVADWAVDMQLKHWPACDAAFAWSFYSQGTREQTAASSDLFLKEALTFFGDPAMAGSAQGAFDKGRRLAQLVGEQRALLILDGVEPLQYPPGPPMDGKLKDDGIAELLKGLAANSHGLCVVTTRYSIPDLRAYWQTTAPEIELKRLSQEAGVELLKALGVETGSKEDFENLVEDVDGHALTLQILGAFLVRAHHGDIRRRDRVKFEKADAKIQGGHAFRAMAAYVKWLEDESEEARREVAILHLLGLFDRPATVDCVQALMGPPAIPGLTEPLVGLAEDDWEFSLTALKDAKLLTVNRDAAGQLISLDAHPLLREYFARQLRTQQPAAWRAAHRRLYEHLCKHEEGEQPTLEDLQPLYQAVAHGCLAGLQQEAFRDVYGQRIIRADEYYSVRKLGAFGADLGAIAGVFDEPWQRPASALADGDKSLLLSQTAFYLRALGRLTESIEPMRAGLRKYVEQQNWKSAAITASNLSELELTLGEVAGAVGDAEQSVTYADRSGDAFQRYSKSSTYADALHQVGRRAEAEARLCEAEQMQAESRPEYPLLYSLPGFRYCDLLLTEAEHAAWQRQGAATFLSPTSPARSAQSPGRTSAVPTTLPEMAAAPQPRTATGMSPLLEFCRAVSKRAAETLKIAERNNWLLHIGLDHLTLGRAALYAAVLSSDSPSSFVVAPGDEGHSSGAVSLRSAPTSHLESAVSGLRRAGAQHHLPRALLTRAWLRFLSGAETGPERAETDLDEAWEIAERGPMRLHMADIHLYRARLFHGVKPYPWVSPQEDLAAARKLIEQCGYWRRKEELEDAEGASKSW